MTAPHLKSELIQSAHGFFGREGGVSGGVFLSLNGSPTSGDDPAAVAENRRRIKETLGADDLVTARQTHSAEAIFVAEPFDPNTPPQADALVTTTPGLAVAVLTADCIPVLLEAPGMVAAVHAGWRGSLGGIIKSAVDLMTAHGASAAGIKAALGPALQRQSFEVRQDLVDQVLAKHPEAEALLTPINSEHWLFDHSNFTILRLLEAGLSPSHICDLERDTLTEKTKYFSHRARCRAGEKSSGRNVSAISLKDES